MARSEAITASMIASYHMICLTKLNDTLVNVIRSRLEMMMMVIQSKNLYNNILDGKYNYISQHNYISILPIKQKCNSKLSLYDHTY